MISARLGRSLGAMLPAAQLVVFAIVARAAAAPVMLPGGEPDANCPDLRLWLRADSGIRDAEGRGPDNPDFSGQVAAWGDRSPAKFDLQAKPGQRPRLAPREPAAGDRPAVAFQGEQVLTRSGALLKDSSASIVLLVIQPQATRGASPLYSVGEGSNRSEALGLVFSSGPEAGLSAVTGSFRHKRQQRQYRLGLALPSDGPAGGRFAAILSGGQPDRRVLEFHDATSEPGDGYRSVTILPPSDTPDEPPRGRFSLGGDGEAFFCGQIAEVLVYNRFLASAERRELLRYIRRRYGMNVGEALFPSGTFFLPAEGFDGDWKPARGSMRADGPASAAGIKTVVSIPRGGTHHVWVRALEMPFNARDRAGSALVTSVQGKALSLTHARGTNEITWRKAGEIELKAGPAEIVVRGEGSGAKECNAVLLSPTAATPDDVEAISALVWRVRRVPAAARVVALFDGGLRLDGSLADGWRWQGPAGRIASPEPAAMPPLRVLQLDRPPPESPRPSAPTAEALFEFHNGDRLCGEIVGYAAAPPRAGRAATGRLLVCPPWASADQAEEVIAVDPGWLRRVVFEPSAHGRRCGPQTLLCRDGRAYEFRAIRWDAQSLSLLTDNGVERVPLGEVAEIRLAADDAWEAYYRQLAALDPQGKHDLLRVETVEGMAFTASAAATAAPPRPPQRPREPPKGPRRRARRVEGPRRLVQPAWSREPIAVPWDDIRLVWQAPAYAVPLSQFAPAEARQRSALGSGWPWQADRNVAGGVLASGGLEYLWGLGVHAPNELVFALPECARGFRASVGIDDVVGAAGRAVAKVYAGQAAGAPLYQSPPLAGAEAPRATGLIALPPGGAAGRRLVLATESADPLGAAGGDPLGIGDHVDWLEPVLLLDPAGLREEVSKRQPAAPPPVPPSPAGRGPG